MRKTSFLLLLMVFGLAVFAQGELQFNQVRNIALSVSGNGATTLTQTQSVTVPSGKVLKVETAYFSYSAASTPTAYYALAGGSNYVNLIINDVIVSSTGSTLPSNGGVYWLPAGTYSFVMQGYINSSGSFILRSNVSCLEFNVIQ
ncbi:MAG: hypothetical protein SFW35_05630 [Chitinophagales bacterium]|nr:hypothetical protein [Chitinophagales bacterium]